jgi:hypothetical protein
MKLHGPFSTDDYGSKIYGTSDRDGGATIVLDIRGWGYLTGRGHGALGLGETEAMAEQVAFARHVAAVLNEAERALLSQEKANE